MIIGSLILGIFFILKTLEHFLRIVSATFKEPTPMKIPFQLTK